MLMASAVKMPTIGIFFFIQKRARHVSAVVHARIQVSFSDSPWARVRRRRTNVGPGNQDPEENESADSKKNILFYFDLVLSDPGTYCTTILPGAQTKFEHQCDVITFQPYTSRIIWKHCLHVRVHHCRTMYYTYCHVHVVSFFILSSVIRLIG